MNNQPLIILLIFYGLFLIACGIVSVALIGLKAKTALASGGLSGLFALSIAYLITIQASIATWAGIFLASALFIVFSWRATKTLFRIFELIPLASEELKGKGIAFLIISLMAVVSIVTLILQLIL
jgi:hypothetical protein